MDIKTALRSLIMIGIVAALVGGATYAVFSDTETSVGNEMVAGTIDMAVNNENPWTEEAWADALHDMKPCEPQTGTIVIENVGMNPMHIWKMLTVTNQNDGVMTEPECVAGGGVATEDANDALVCSSTYVPRYNLKAWTHYGMTVTVTDNNADDDTDTHSTCISEPVSLVEGDGGVFLKDVSAHYIYLGTLYPTDTMTVIQTYHLDGDVGNWAQGDILTFNIELYGEQIVGSGDKVPPGDIYAPQTS